MVQRTSARQKRLLREFGANIQRWRKINGLSASELAERAFVTRETLLNLEQGTGAPRFDSVIAVLTALGIADGLLAASDPFQNNAGRARIDEILNSGGTI